MIDQKIVRNYASSLFSNITLDTDHQKVLEQLALFSEILLSSNLAHFALCSPIITHFDKLKLIKAFTEKFKFEKIVSRFFAVMVKNSRFQILSSIVIEYEKLLAKSRGIKSVILESANKPSEKELGFITEYLENKLKQVVKLDVLENKSLIGGVVIKYDSLLYDYSIAGAIDRVAQIAKNVRL